MEIKFPLGVHRIYQGLYKTVEDPSLDSIVSWGKSNRSFLVWNEEELLKILRTYSAPKFKDLSHMFKFHGFKRINGTSGQLEYACSYFVRGQPELLIKMRAKVHAYFRKMCRDDNQDQPKNNLPQDQASAMEIKFPQGVRRIYKGMYMTVGDPSLDSIVSWGKSNNSLIVWNEEELLKIFRTYSAPKFKDLSGMLNFYGFKRINETSGQLEYACNCFVRGQLELLNKMPAKVHAYFMKMCRDDNQDQPKNNLPQDQAADTFQHLRIN